MLNGKTKIAIATLLLTLALACAPSTINFLLATFAPETVRLMHLPERERVCAEELFSATHTALERYKASPSPDAWAEVRKASAQFQVRRCSDNAAFVDVVSLGQRILASVEQPPSPGARVQPATPDFGRVDEDAVKELKRKVEGLKKK